MVEHRLDGQAARMSCNQGPYRGSIDILSPNQAPSINKTYGIQLRDLRADVCRKAMRSLAIACSCPSGAALRALMAALRGNLQDESYATQTQEKRESPVDSTNSHAHATSDGAANGDVLQTSLPEDAPYFGRIRKRKLPSTSKLL